MNINMPKEFRHDHDIYVNVNDSTTKNIKEIVQTTAVAVTASASIIMFVKSRLS